MLFEKIIQNLSLFTDLQKRTLTDIAQVARLHHYKKGIIIYNAFDPKKSYFYYILRGWVKLFTVSREGIEIITHVLTDEHHFNEGLLFANNLEPFSAQTISDVQMIIIPIVSLKRWLQQDSQLAFNLLKQSLHRQLELRYEIEHLSIQNAAQRIGCFLLRLAPLAKSKAFTLDLPYDKALLAARLGMCPETFSRALVKLNRQWGIQVNGEKVHIDNVDALSRYVCKRCSLTYPCHTISTSF